jgi:hypothetical protein
VPARWRHFFFEPTCGRKRKRVHLNRAVSNLVLQTAQVGCLMRGWRRRMRCSHRSQHAGTGHGVPSRYFGPVASIRRRPQPPHVPACVLCARSFTVRHCSHTATVCVWESGASPATTPKSHLHEPCDGGVSGEGGFAPGAVSGLLEVGHASLMLRNLTFQVQYP